MNIYYLINININIYNILCIAIYIYCYILHDVHDVHVVILLYINTNALPGIVTGNELPKLDTPRLKSVPFGVLEHG